MKTNDQTLDELIRSSLSQEEADYYKSLEKEENFMQEMYGIYSGKRRWLSFIALIYTFVFLGIAVFAVIQFFNSEEVKDLIFFAALFILVYY